MIKENSYCGDKKKFSYDLDDNGYYVPCEKEQQVIRQILLMRKEGKTFREISSKISKSTRKLFPVSWCYKIVKRENNMI